MHYWKGTYQGKWCPLHLPRKKSEPWLEKHPKTCIVCCNFQIEEDSKLLPATRLLLKERYSDLRHQSTRGYMYSSKSNSRELPRNRQQLILVNTLHKVFWAGSCIAFPGSMMTHLRISKNLPSSPCSASTVRRLNQLWKWRGMTQWSLFSRVVESVGPSHMYGGHSPWCLGGTLQRTCFYILVC